MSITHHNSKHVYSRVMEGQSRGLFPHAVSANEDRLVFLSGQLAWDINGNTVGKGNMRTQFRQVGENIKAVLTEAGGSLSDIIKITTLVTNMEQFFHCIDIRDEYFGPGWPASTTYEVSRLAHPDMLIEVEAIAAISN
jgi:2-iminobutanoate/2-iminopropanoate deaminase